MWRRISHLPSPWWLVAAGLALLYAPSFWHLFHGAWSQEDQAHGPIILGLSLWLIWRQRAAVATAHYAPSHALAWPLMGLAMMLYVLGRSQGVLIFEIGSIPVLASALLLLHGPGALKAAAFGVFFLIFMIPLPSPLIDAITQPMKIAVSFATSGLLFAAGYPIANSGVVLQIAQYQLQVADACAGLHTLFALEALGLIYLNVVRHGSMVRNVLLALLIIPISFTANVIRVTVLTLITYYWGDAAGQGFLHDFAGWVLFLAALVLIVLVDLLLRLLSQSARFNFKFKSCLSVLPVGAR
jgi:exosortase B